MVVQYKCPGCGADMQYDSRSKKLKCSSCGRETDIEEASYEVPDAEGGGEADAPELSPFSANTIKDETEFEELQAEPGFGSFDGTAGRQYACQNCGAVVITTADTAATHCSFCGAPVVLGDRLSGELAPAKIIPFTIGKEQAQEEFRKWCGGGKLTPRDFMTADRIKSITGMYVPFWLYDMGGTGEADCTATRVRTYTRGDYIYTETKYYHVYRRVSMAYCMVPADASEKMDDTLMDCLEPFPSDQMKDFKLPYLAGYLAEKYNYNDEQLLPRVMKRVNSYAEAYLQSTIQGYTSVTWNRKSIDLKKVNARYTLLPVWMVCYDYRDKEHVFAMNGQTGKIVGSPPLSAGRIAAWFTGISAGVFALLRVIALFLR
ncbi:MAG: hypothetical protein K2N94_05325 [Lachnospiraceae bacterium]|nr:hypothetical protein [Lachnospiraceae bacterium]